jgi:16S rRNA (cytosine967-C5)-methyltransferase
LAVLVETEQSEDGADMLLDRTLAKASLDSRDRGLAVELTYGVLRRLGTIDWRLEPLLNRPLPRLPLVVRMLLRLGGYQVLFLDRIPPSAAVNESVGLAKRHIKHLKRDWGGFVNAVLRRLIRDPVPSWPSIETEAPKALAVKHSVPEWLSRRWIERLGVEKASLACEQVSSIPPVTLRVNRLKTTREDLLARLHRAGISAAPTMISPVGIVVERGGSVTALPGFDEGLFYVEDEAGQLIPPLLDARPGDSILDACAAPGGKAIHLAELMCDRGAIYAVDRKGTRLELVQLNCGRLGIHSVRPIVGDVRYPSAWGKGKPVSEMRFDRILVDAPCSGLGVLRRHPEAKWRKGSALFERHHRLQYQILDAVVPFLRPGGVLVYSTCSTELEENESVIDNFLNAHAEFRRDSVAPWLSESGRGYLTARGEFSTMGNEIGMDWFYAARLIKAG